MNIPIDDKPKEINAPATQQGPPLPGYTKNHRFMVAFQNLATKQFLSIGNELNSTGKKEDSKELKYGHEVNTTSDLNSSDAHWFIEKWGGYYLVRPCLQPSLALTSHKLSSGEGEMKPVVVLPGLDSIEAKDRPLCKFVPVRLNGRSFFQLVLDIQAKVDVKVDEDPKEEPKPTADNGFGFDERGMMIDTRDRRNPGINPDDPGWERIREENRAARERAEKLAAKKLAAKKKRMLEELAAKKKRDLEELKTSKYLRSEGGGLSLALNDDSYVGRAMDCWVPVIIPCASSTFIGKKAGEDWKTIFAISDSPFKALSYQIDFQQGLSVTSEKNYEKSDSEENSLTQSMEDSLTRDDSTSKDISTSTERELAEENEITADMQIAISGGYDFLFASMDIEWNGNFGYTGNSTDTTTASDNEDSSVSMDKSAENEISFENEAALSNEITSFLGSSSEKTSSTSTSTTLSIDPSIKSFRLQQRITHINRYIETGCFGDVFFDKLTVTHPEYRSLEKSGSEEFRAAEREYASLKNVPPAPTPYLSSSPARVHDHVYGKNEV